MGIESEVCVNPRHIHRYLETLTWAPTEEASHDWGGNFAMRLAEVHTLREQTLVSWWSDLDDELLPPGEEPKPEGRVVVLDPEPPPWWLYACHCLYVGDEGRRPRGFLPLEVVC